MNDQWERECADLRAEPAAPQNKVHALEGKRAGATGNAPTPSRRRLSKRMMVGMLPAVVLLAAGETLYGQGTVDALFIDPRGYVGVGTDRPGEKLEVKGGKIQLDGDQQLKFTDADTSNKLKLQLWSGTGLGINDGTLFYAAMGRHSWRDSTGTNERMALTTGADGGLTVLGTGASSFVGNVGIGTPDPKAILDVSGKADTLKQISLQLRSGNTAANFNSNQITFGYSNTDTYRHAIKTRHHSGQQAGNAIDFYVWNYDQNKSDPTAIGGLHTMTLDGGKVGIGTTKPDDPLDVGGALRVLTGSNPIRFTSKWSDFPQTAKNRAEISNDTDAYKTLMIVGNRSADGSTRRVGIWDQLVVSGDLFVTGRLVYKWGNDWKQVYQERDDWAGSRGTTGPTSSDLRLKSHVRPLPTALIKILHLRGVSYQWNDEALEHFARDIESSLSAGPDATAAQNEQLWKTERDRRYKELNGVQVGVVAQDVEAVLPEAVTTDEAGYKSVRYHYLIPLLIEALKEQNRTVQEQAVMVAQQQQEIARLAAASLAVQQKLAELAAVKEQIARLEAMVQGAAATSAVNAMEAAQLSETRTR